MYRCDKCEQDYFKKIEEVLIGKTIFDKYECLSCGEIIFLQTEKELSERDEKAISKFSIEPNKSGILGIGRLPKSKIK